MHFWRRHTSQMVLRGSNLGGAINRDGRDSLGSDSGYIRDLQRHKTMVDPKHKKLWELMNTYLGHNERSIQKQIVEHMEYTYARSRFTYNATTICLAGASSLKDRLTECFNDTAQLSF